MFNTFIYKESILILIGILNYSYISCLLVELLWHGNLWRAIQLRRHQAICRWVISMFFAIIFCGTINTVTKLRDEREKKRHDKERKFKAEKEEERGNRIRNAERKKDESQEKSQRLKVSSLVPGSLLSCKDIPSTCLFRKRPDSLRNYLSFQSCFVNSCSNQPFSLDARLPTAMSVHYL